jgi:hypothetical protein
MKKNIISKALAGSVLVAASMSANAVDETITVNFGVLPAIVIDTTSNFAPGAILTGTNATTCTWTPTFLNSVSNTGGGSGVAGAVGDVNVVRDGSGGGCPTAPIATGTVETTGVYTIDGGATALNVDVNIALIPGVSTNITFDPIGVGTPDDISYPAVDIPTTTPTAVNTGGNGLIVLYLGGTTTIGGTDITAAENVDFTIQAVY